MSAVVAILLMTLGFMLLMLVGMGFARYLLFTLFEANAVKATVQVSKWGYITTPEGSVALADRIIRQG